MTRRAAFVVASALALAMCLAAAARAAESVLAIVPSDALFVELVKNLSDADAKIHKLEGLVQAPPGDLRDLLRSDPGVDRGVDEKGTLVVIVLAGDGDKEPAAILAVPVADYQQLVGQLPQAKPDGRIVKFKPPHGPAGVAARRGDYVLFTEGSDRKSLEKVLDAKQSVAGELAPIEPWLAENDAAFVATRAGIRWAAAKGQAELKKAKKDAEDLPGDAGGSADTARSVLGFYDQALALAEKEVALAAVGIAVDEQSAVRVTGRVRFVKDSKFGESLAAIKPADQDLMAGLPGGPFVFAFGGPTPEPLMKRLTAMGAGFVQECFSRYGVTPEQAGQLAKISLQSLEQTRALWLVAKTGKRGEPIFGNIFATFRVDNAPQHLEQYEKDTEAQNRIVKGAKQSGVKFAEVKKTQIGGRPALEVEETVPLTKAESEDPAQQAMMQAWFGPNYKMTTYLAAANETTVVEGLGTTPQKVGEVIEMVRSAKPGLAADKDVAATAALLPAGAQWVAYFSPRGCVGIVRRMMQAEMAATPPGAPLFMPQLPPFPQTPPVGLAVKAASSGLEASIVVPAAIPKAIGEYIATINQAEENPQIP
jgi:hypothetical protein